GKDPLETFLDVIIRVAEQSYALKTWACFSIDLTLRKTYIIDKDPLEIFLDIIIRVATQIHNFKT
ncbi:hypothetical protein A2U01_0090281, partial [Trifolium medium]|nr:hypothetical protein [Trifolium medium]